MKLLNLKQTNHKTNWRFKLGMISLISMVFCILTGAVFNVADAYPCPLGDSQKCTRVNLTTCDQVDQKNNPIAPEYIPDFASRAACEYDTNTDSVGSTWVNYPKSGVRSSKEEYIHLPISSANFQSVHLWTSRLGRKVISPTPSSSRTLVGTMSLETANPVGGSDNNNTKLAHCAANYLSYYSPVLHTVPLKEKNESPYWYVDLADFKTKNGTKKLVDLAIPRPYSFNKGIMQPPSFYGGAQVDMREVNSRCEAQFNQDDYANKCTLTIYLGTSAIEGYALLNQKVTLKIHRQMPDAAVTFWGSVTRSKPSAKLGDDVSFTHKFGATYIGVVKNAKAVYSFSGNTISGPANGTKTLTVNYNGQKESSQSQSVTETHKITAADVERGKVCRKLSWTSSGTSPVPINDPDPPVAEACITVEPASHAGVSTKLLVGGSDKGSTYNSATNPFSVKPSENVIFRHNLAVKAQAGASDSLALKFSGDTVDSAQANKTIKISGTSVSPSPGNFDEKYKATNNDLGKTICRKVEWSSGNGSTKLIKDGKYSDMACIKVPYNYTLDPKIKLKEHPANTAATPGEEIKVVGEVGKGSNDTWSRNTQWQLTKFIVPKGNNPQPGGDNNSIPCTYFKHGSYPCEAIGYGTGKVFKDTSTEVYNQDILIENLEVGSKICFALSVQPYSHSSDEWRHSTPHCVTVSKTPKAQIHGSSLMVPNGKVQAGVTTITTSAGHPPCASASGSVCRYGSWMEYDILARDAVANAASAVGYPATSGDLLYRHRLTFANVSNSYGQYYSGSDINQADRISEYYLGLPGRSSLGGATVNIYDLARNANNSGKFDVYHQKSSAPLTLTSSAQPTIPTVNPAKTVVVIKENGNLVVGANLAYTLTGIASPRSQPQLILIAKNGNIIINSNVTQVDAWLIATSNDTQPNTRLRRGRLLTCNADIDPASGKPTNLSADVCRNPLRINGPVVVDYLDLYRTHGSEVVPANTMDQPAELFNFRPDAYLWSYANSSSGKVILETTYTKELPVRY